jgi:hypothetical protein
MEMKFLTHFCPCIVSFLPDIQRFDGRCVVHRRLLQQHIPVPSAIWSKEGELISQTAAFVFHPSIHSSKSLFCFSGNFVQQSTSFFEEFNFSLFGLGVLAFLLTDTSDYLNPRFQVLW